MELFETIQRPTPTAMAIADLCLRANQTVGGYALINAIKDFRTVTGSGLKEAKDIVEAARDIRAAKDVDGPAVSTADQIFRRV